jgi:hypothetical protein
MNRLAAALAAAQAGLSGARFALVGGIAVSARADPRFTRDIDLAVEVPDDARAEAVVRGMMQQGFRIAATVEQDAAGRLATVRLHAPGEPEAGIIVDLLFASSGIEPEVAGASEVLEVFAGLKAPVARTGHLIALKLLARDDAQRPQDSLDLRALVPVATADDLDLARAGVQLIAARGFHRGRDLPADLEAALAEFGPARR